MRHLHFNQYNYYTRFKNTLSFIYDHIELDFLLLFQGSSFKLRKAWLFKVDQWEPVERSRSFPVAINTFAHVSASLNINTTATTPRSATAHKIVMPKHNCIKTSPQLQLKNSRRCHVVPSA